MESFVIWSLKVWPARGLNNFISAASILRLCEAVKVQFSDPYKNVVEEYGGAGEVADDNMIGRMRVVCWIPKGTDTPRICNTYCFSTLQ
jgi:hypothetical protein